MTISRVSGPGREGGHRIMPDIKVGSPGSSSRPPRDFFPAWPPPSRSWKRPPAHLRGLGHRHRGAIAGWTWSSDFGNALGKKLLVETPASAPASSPGYSRRGSFPRRGPDLDAHGSPGGGPDPGGVLTRRISRIRDGTAVRVRDFASAAFFVIMRVRRGERCTSRLPWY